MSRCITAAVAAQLLIIAGLGSLGGTLPPAVARPFPSIVRVSPTRVEGLTPALVRKAYGIDLLPNTGAGRTIAIVVAYGSPTIQQDLALFSRQFGLPPASLIIAYPQGKPDKVDSGWAVETALDAEWVHAMAPGAAIQLVVARSAKASNLLAAVDYAAQHGAQVVSMSWGTPEFASEAAFDTHFAAPGVRFVASSGDRGHGTSWPAVSPNVLAVGGTTLLTQPDGSYAGETAWSGSGGGVSAFESIPAYQRGFQASDRRTVPDVAMLADPSTGVAVYNSTPYNGAKGWFLVGGTSVGAPVWAAVLARAPGADTADLYALAGSAHSADYHDVSTGSNGSCGKLCTAGIGYDAVTGVGSPQADSLVPALGRP